MSAHEFFPINVVKIPQHKFVFGNVAFEAEAGTDISPVVVESFFLAATPVTERAWTIFESATGYRRKLKGFEVWNWGWQKAPYKKIEGRTDYHPAVGVTYDDSIAFCQWLSGLYDVDVRLPTEIEYEAAAKAQCACSHFCSAAKKSASYVRAYGEPAARTCPPVMQQLPNAFGLYDMNGVVWQWCSDKVLPDRSIPSTAFKLGGNSEVSWNGKMASNARVIRGGSFAYPVTFARCAQRSISCEGDANFNLGFRFAISFNGSRADWEKLKLRGLRSEHE